LNIMNTMNAVATPGREGWLAEVEDALRTELPPGGGPLLEAARHLCLAPAAKRARPRLCFLFGEIAGAPPAAMVDVAVAVELIHAASLLHDDVVDEGRVRRGRPTANARFGNAAAVLAGDHVLSRAILRLAGHPRDLTVRAVEVVAEMAAAAVVEVEARRHAVLLAPTWRAMAVGKTGALFGLCGFAAGVLAGDPAAGRRLEQAGRSLGVAFQLQDDLHDLVTDLKDRFADVREGNPSFVLLAAAARDRAFRRRLEAAWALPEVPADDVRALGEAALASPAVDDALALLRAEVETARVALGASPAAARILAWADTLGADPRAGGGT
jgi:octaprenyl-diphosphate synthase